jgi:hypothetical protein
LPAKRRVFLVGPCGSRTDERRVLTTVAVRTNASRQQDSGVARAELALREHDCPFAVSGNLFLLRAAALASATGTLAAREQD